MIELIPARDDERENFIVNIQAAFKKAVVEEYGDIGKEVIPRGDVEKSFNAEGAEILDIVSDGKIVGGAVVVIRPNNHNDLSLFYVNVDCHGQGIGFAAWQAIEQRYPQTEIWETFTPYFEKRNLHFYINKCGFRAVEFFNKRHPHKEFGDEKFFRFEKVMRQ